MNEFVAWAQTHPIEFLFAIVAFVGLLGAAIDLAGRAWDRRRAQPAGEEDDPLDAVVEQKEVIEDWLDGEGGVDVLDALAAVHDLIRPLGEIDLPGASDAWSLAIRAEDELSQGHQTLENLIAAADRLIEAAEQQEESAWPDRRERVGSGAKGG